MTEDEQGVASGAADGRGCGAEKEVDTGEKTSVGARREAREEGRVGLNPTSTEGSGSGGGGSGKDVKGRHEGRATRGGRTGRGARATGT